MPKTSQSRCTPYLFFILAMLLAACKSSLPTTQPTPNVQPSQTPLPAPTHTPAPTSPILVARVNGEGIPLDEYEAGLRQLQKAVGGQESSPGGVQQRVLEWLVDETLLAQAACSSGFNLTDPELDERIDRLAKEMGGAAELQDWQHRMGYDQALFQRALRQSIAATWQRDRILERVAGKAEQARARQLLFVSREAAEQALSLLKKGEVDFTSLAYQRDPAKGGDLGWFPRGYLTQPAVEEAAFSLAPGELSPVIETGLGYHLLLSVAREDRPLTPETRLALQRKTLADWLAQQRAQAELEVLLPTAQESDSPPDQVGNPVYTVQAGESVYSIASQFGITPEELLQANSLSDPGTLLEGSDLQIPGRSGCQDHLKTEILPPGFNLKNFTRLRGIDEGLFVRLNRLTSPAELVAGATLVLPQDLDSGGMDSLPALKAGQSFLEYATALGQDPWRIVLANQAGSPDELLPGEALFFPSGSQAAPYDPLAPVITSFALDSLPLVQGNTEVIRVQTRSTAEVTGSLDGRSLHFFPSGEGEYVAIQGIHAMAEPGLASFSLEASTGDGQATMFEQRLLLEAGNFVEDPPLEVDPHTLDPSFTLPEEQLLASLTAPATPEKYWDGPFGVPVERSSCTPSGFGNRRAYNGGPYIYFHGGLDYGLCANPHIFAPAAGVVVYTGALTVRGNATLIDHGWGVYSGFWHQSEIYVQPGERVERGQLIGKIGATGRVTGEHAHWEVWAGGVQVNPRAWLGRSFP